MFEVIFVRQSVNNQSRSRTRIEFERFFSSMSPVTPNNRESAMYNSSKYTPILFGVLFHKHRLVIHWSQASQSVAANGKLPTANGLRTVTIIVDKSFEILKYNIHLGESPEMKYLPYCSDTD